MTDNAAFEIDRTQRRLGPIWLTPGVMPGHVLTLFYSSMITIVFITSIGVLFPYLLHEHLKVPTEVQGNYTGNLIVILELTVIAIAIPVGIASDRWGRRPIFTAGFLIVFISLVLMPLARTGEALVLYRVMSGVGVAFGTTMMATTIADYPQNASRGKFISINGIITNIGVILLTAVVLSQLPQFFIGRGADAYAAGSYTFWTMAGLALLTALITWTGLKGGRAIAHASRRFSDLLLTGAAEVRRNPRLRLACAAYFVSRGDLTVFVMFFTLWLVAVGTDAGMPTAEAQSAAGRMFGIAQVSMLLFTPVIGWMVDYFDRVVALAISMAIAFIGYLALGIVVDPLNSPWMYLAAVLGGAGEAAVVVSGPALVGQEAAPKVRGSIIGFVTLFGALGVLINSKISGVIFDAWMYQAPFVFMAGMNLLIVIAAMAVRLWEIRTGVVTHPTAAAALKANAALEK
jgi:MFS family permease